MNFEQLPTNPAIGDTYVYNHYVWKWDGKMWHVGDMWVARTGVLPFPTPRDQMAADVIESKIRGKLK